VKEITEFNYLTGAILKDKKMKICPRHSFAEGYARTFSIAGETCTRFLNILKAEIFIFLEKKLFFSLWQSVESINVIIKQCFQGGSEIMTLEENHLFAFIINAPEKFKKELHAYLSMYICTHMLR
jgi:hypothetical protein